MIYDLPMKRWRKGKRENSTDYDELFSRLKWMSLENRIKYRKCVLVYKSLNGLAPDYMSDMFTYIHEVHNRT